MKLRMSRIARWGLSTARPTRRTAAPGSSRVSSRPHPAPPRAGALPLWERPPPVYRLGTPNGVKVTSMLEELLELGHSGAEYDAWKIDIGEGAQFGSGFVAINPNSKIPALLDRSDPVHPQRVFESGAILLYLAETFGALLTSDPAGRAAALSRLMWHMGWAPETGGGCGVLSAHARAR